jgi:hypothetical protein
MFTISDVQSRFLSKYPHGSFSTNSKKCLVTFNQTKKGYEYSYKNPIDLIRRLELATDDELLVLEGKKRCDCGSRELVKLEETECFRCKEYEDIDLFS